MATRKLEVQIIGDSRSLERAFARSSAASNRFSNNANTMGGRLDRTAKKFSNLQSAFVGGLAFSAGIAGIRSVVTAAAESQQVLGQTRVALEATGKSWVRYGKQIEDTIKAQSRLGFDDEALLRTFSLFERTTSDVTKSLRLNALAMDVARARYIDLEQAAQLVNKAAIGQAGALRRLGINVRAGASAQELLTALTEKYGGAAQKAGNDATTAFDRAQVSIENAKEEIGGNLLPTVAGLSNTLAETLDLFVQLGKVKIPAVHIPMVFDFGGGEGSTLGNIVHKGIFTLPEFVELTKKVVNNLLDNWRQATDTQTASAAAQFGAILNGFTTNVINQGLAGAKVPQVAPTKVKGFGTGLTPKDLFGPLIKQIPASLQEALLDAQISGSQSRIRAVLVRILGAMTKALEDPRLQRPGRIAIKTIIDSIKGQIRAIDSAIASAADTASADKASKAAAASAKRAAALEKIAQANKAAAAAAKTAEQARQFRAIGLAPTGEEIVPTAANLTKQFQSLSKRVIGEDVPKNLRDRLRKVGRFLKGDLKGITEDTRRAIKELFDAIRGEFDKGSKSLGGPLTKTTTLNTQRILGNVTGLDRDQIRQIRANLSNFNSAGVALAGATTAAGGPITVNTSVNLDGQKVAQNTTIHQQKATRRNPRQKRGPNRSGI